MTNEQARHRAYNHHKRLSGLCLQCSAIWLGPQWKCDACRARQNAANRARWASLTAEERAPLYRQRNSYRMAAPAEVCARQALDAYEAGSLKEKRA